MVNWELWLFPILAAATTSVAEWLHGRRCRRMARLAFGAEGRPRRWVRGTPVMRAAAVGALSWGLLVLLQIDRALWAGPPAESQKHGKKPVHHLVIALDVSPSMHLKDAGPTGKNTRGEQARVLLRSILDRLDQRQTGVTILAFYSDGKPVVLDTVDPEVVANILGDLPLEHAFEPGKTNLYRGVKATAEVAKAWRPRSATLVVVSDGDTLPAEETPLLPPAMSNVLVLGVGNPHRGMYIDGHSSRQDTRSLKTLALRLGGLYHDGNRKHVPTPVIEYLVQSISGVRRGPLALRELAILTVAASGVLLAFLSPSLALLGTSSRMASAQKPAPRNVVPTTVTD